MKRRINPEVAVAIAVIVIVPFFAMKSPSALAPAGGAKEAAKIEAKTAPAKAGITASGGTAQARKAGPEFSQPEFSHPFNVEKLCQGIARDRYTLTLTSADNTIERLNELLTIPKFYDIVTTKKKEMDFSRDLIDLAEKTADFRKKEYANLTPDGQSAIRRLNRLLIEEVYPDEAPRLKRERYAGIAQRNIFSTDGTYLPVKAGTQRIEDRLQLLGVIKTGVKRALIVGPKNEIMNLKTGDSFDGITVKSITDVAVKLQVGRKDVELKVFDPTKKVADLRPAPQPRGVPAGSPPVRQPSSGEEPRTRKPLVLHGRSATPPPPPQSSQILPGGIPRQPQAGVQASPQQPASQQQRTPGKVYGRPAQGAAQPQKR